MTNISACAADNCGGTKPSSTADNKALSTKISANGVGSSGGYISSIVSTSSVLTFSSFVSRDLSTIGTNTFSVAATTAFKEGSSSMESVSKSRKTSRKKLLEKSYKKKQESEGEQVRFCQSNTVRNGFDFSLSSSALGQQDNTNTPMVPNFSFGLPDTSSSTVPISNLACTSTAHVHVSEQTLTSANLQTLSKTARMDESQSAVRESSAGISPNCSNTAVAGSEVISLPSTQPVSWKVSTQAISHPTVSDTKHMNGEYTASAFVPYIPRSELSSVKPNPVGMPSSAAELISPESSKCNTLANSFAKANHTSNSQVDSATVGKVKNVRKVLKKVKRLQHSVLNKHEQPFSPLSASYNDAFPPLTSSVSAFQSVTAGECSIRPISAAEGTDISNSPAVPSYSGSTNMYASLGSVAACIPTDSGVVKDCCTKSGGQVSLTANVTSSGTLSVTSKGSLAATTWSLQTLRLSSTQITTTTTPSATLSHTLTLAAASPDSDVKEGGARATQTTPIKGTSKGKFAF